jgi:AraC-like DNA-binding protein/mannose-6-phosphate isomerase-like protein (cupin superfamily)
MALQKCGLNLGRNRLELQPHGTLDFPCSGYRSQHTESSDDIIVWHWHEEMEIIYLQSGQMKLQVPGKTYHLQQGEAIFINSNVLHFAIAEKYCELLSLVFHSSLVTGQDKSVFAQKYIIPLVSCVILDSCHITPVLNQAQTIIDHFIQAFEALAMEPYGYEFTVRENLSRICLTLYQQNELEIKNKDTALKQDSIRIQKMMDFIHEHYSEDLTLSQIAKSAAIGERECLRCFQRGIQISPMQYLLKVRVMQGASMLLQAPERSISEISILCGFDSPSNFSQMFKRYYMCTPRNYRIQIK